MSEPGLFRGLTVDKSIADKIGFNPYYLSIEGGLSGIVKIGDSEYFNLASNNYLGLASDPRVKSAICEGVNKFGASMCGTPIATGSCTIFSRLERKLAAFCGLEAAAVFPSCYQANAAVFQALCGKGDLLIADHYIHASLATGLQATGSKIKPFLHNNVAHLESLLQKRAPYGRTLVVTESVFSTEGSLAPFDEMAGLCRRYRAIPVVDDSHGIGTIGENGRGVLEHFGIKNYTGLYTASLGKALANSGGVVAGPAKVIEYLKYRCPALIYSTALTPASAAGTLAVLDIIKGDYAGIGAGMRRNNGAVSDCLRKAGMPLAEGQAAITSVICPSSEAAVKLSRILFEHRILSTPFIPPSVPPNKGLVRLIAGADLDEGRMQEVLRRLGAAAAVFKGG